MGDIPVCDGPTEIEREEYCTGVVVDGDPELPDCDDCDCAAIHCAG